ncbi:MAG: 16S rRNA (cytidine(1402)-2'-O)-methyltransferase [Pseudomonadota bacterium]
MTDAARCRIVNSPDSTDMTTIVDMRGEIMTGLNISKRTAARAGAAPDEVSPDAVTDDMSGDRAESSVETADRSNLAGGKLAPGLYLAATPIGAAADVTLGVLNALACADVIAAEDTRRARKLMEIHGVKRAGRPMIPYHDHNAAGQRPGLLARIEAGESVVCVSDAGTPLIADPGWRLAREAIDRDLPVVALPGASAVLAALSVSGLPTDRFLFAGFAPPKQAARRADLASLAPTPATLVFYESPRRLGALLADMVDVLGGDRQAAVSRELTKLYEETLRGTLTELAERYAKTPPRGEIVVCVGPPPPKITDTDDIDDALREALKTERVRDAAKRVAETFSLPRREVYARALNLDQTDRTLEED